MKNTMRLTNKITAVLLTAAMMVGGLAGCSAKSDSQTASSAANAETTNADTGNTDTTNADTKNAESETVEAEKTGESITLTDAAGREITLSAPAEKIVSGYYITTSMLIALGLKDRAVGIEAKANKRPIYKLAAPEFLNLPSVGTAKDFDVEGCASLKPDLVILPKKLTEQADILAGIGINAMVVNPESFKEIEETIVNISKATGTESKAEALLSYYKEKSTMLEKIVSDKSAQEQAQPVIYMAGVSSVLRTAGQKMYQNDLIGMAGGINAAAEIQGNGWTDISYEALLKYNPDMIVIVSDAEYTKADVLADAQLKGLDAVKEGRIYEMPSAFEAWDSPVTSGILGCMWLSSIVNEEQYSFDTFKKDAAEFYKTFYGVEIEPNLITK